jgi:hypothetical protein
LFIGVLFQNGTSRKGDWGLGGDDNVKGGIGREDSRDSISEADCVDFSRAKDSIHSPCSKVGGDADIYAWGDSVTDKHKGVPGSGFLV